jgi:hypothetical protein
MEMSEQGLTKKEAVRSLKRYVAREMYSLLPHEKLALALVVRPSFLQRSARRGA